MHSAADPERQRASASDSLLKSYLTSTDQRSSDEALRGLLEQHAAAVIRRVLFRQSGGARQTQSGGEDVEDVASATRELLLRQLTALRSGERETPIADFESYVASVTYSAWAAYLRDAHPQRSMLLNRVRYLLENRTNQRGFAIWDGAGGGRWCGPAQWRNQRQRMEPSPKAEWLLLDPIAAARDAFGHTHLATMTLADLFAGIFKWLGRAIELKALVDVSAVVLELTDETAATGAEDAAHAGLSPIDALKWREYLEWLAKQMPTLSLPQRTAFLLHSDVTLEFDFVGAASIRQIAEWLAIPAGEFAELWKAIPLNDLTIASRLGLQRQQVINLRRAARERLGASWKEWINDSAHQ